MKIQELHILKISPLYFLFASILLMVSDLWCSDARTNAQIPFGIAKMRIEFNSTDEDVGIQVDLDAEAWRKVRIVSPNGQTIFEVNGDGKLRKLGLTELFFESEEPALEDLPLEDFFALFPEGEYRFTGTTVEGVRLTSTVVFTHNIPDGPIITSPEKKGVDPLKAFVRWDPVTTPAGIQIVAYHVIVETDFNPLRVFEIDLPATATRVKVPNGFLKSGKKYKVEVLAIEAGGNQTISEQEFKTK